MIYGQVLFETIQQIKNVSVVTEKLLFFQGVAIHIGAQLSRNTSRVPNPGVAGSWDEKCMLEEEILFRRASVV